MLSASFVFYWNQREEIKLGWIALFIGAFLLLLISSSIPAVTASTSGTGMIEITDATGVKGENVTITIRAQADEVAGYEANITFDPGVAEVKSIEPVDIRSWTTLNNTRNNERGWLTVTGSNDSGLQSPRLLNITFELHNTTESPSPLSFVDKDTRLNNENSFIQTETTDGYITSLEPPFFDISIENTNSPVNETERVNITVNTTNAGGAKDTQNVSLNVNEVQGIQDKEGLSVEPGNSSAEVLNWETEDGDAGNYRVEVATEDTVENTSVKVLQKSEFGLDIVDSNNPTEGNELVLSVNVTNIGDRSLTRTVTLNIPQLGNTSKKVMLNGGESSKVNLSLGTDTTDEGTYTALVSVGNSMDSTNVSVGNSSLFIGPLISEFDNPPKNTGVLDQNLYEDLDGDGDGTEVGPAVSVFGKLIRGNDLGLMDAQARKLNWNEDSPETEVTVADMVTLFGEKIRSE
jgi:hypothetical protein